METTQTPIDLEERNKEICRLYAVENMTSEEIGQAVNLTKQRICQILKENSGLLKRDIDWEKAKRVNKLSRWIDNETTTRKDVVDLMEQQRKELEGDKPEIDQSKHLHQTYVWINQSPTDSISAPRLSDGNTYPSSEVSGS